MSKRIISAVLSLAMFSSSFSVTAVINAEETAGTDKAAVTGAETEVNASPEGVLPVRWKNESDYEKYNEIEIGPKLRDALVIPDDPEVIKIMAAKEKKGFLYLLYRMPASIYFLPVSGKQVDTKAISEYISKKYMISEDEFSVETFQTTVYEGDTGKITDAVSLNFKSDYFLNERLANSLCAYLSMNGIASKVYFTPDFYNSEWIEVHTNYPSEYSEEIAEVLKENGIEAEVKTSETSSEYCQVIITDSYESTFKAIELIYVATGLKSSVSSFLEGSSITLPAETQVFDFISKFKGDIDLSGNIDVTDLTNLSLALLGDKVLAADEQKAADTDDDGTVTLADLAMLRQYLSKKISRREFENITLESIVDITERDGLAIPAAMEIFYEDEDYVYEFGGIKSNYVECTFSDGTVMNVKDALEFGMVTIADLDKYEIDYRRTTENR